MTRNNVILVTKNDQPITVAGKLQAHVEGLLHRAFSVFIFNDKGEMLLQQRADDKYHGGGLWTNACCSHPQWGEDICESAAERLQFEMGLQCVLKKVFSFIYHTEVENGLTEYEYDHVFVGYTNKEPAPNPTEVKDIEWVEVDALREDVKKRPERYTYWFRSAMPRILESIR